MLTMDSDIKEEIRAWVRSARKSAGLSGADLGAKLALELGTERGHSKGNISHWELGKHQPNLQQLIAIAHITGVPLPPAVIGPLPGLDFVPSTILVTQEGAPNEPNENPGCNLQWLTPEEERLLTLFRQTDDAGKASILTAAHKASKTVSPSAIETLGPDVVDALRKLLDSRST